MDNETTAIDPDEAVSAFFENRDDADRAEAALKAAGFTDETLYVVPRSPGVTVTVAAPNRIKEAADILSAAGGEPREADVNASGSVMFRIGPSHTAHPGSKPPRPVDTPESDIFSPGSNAGGDGAGTAGGGQLW